MSDLECALRSVNRTTIGINIRKLTPGNLCGYESQLSGAIMRDARLTLREEPRMQRLLRRSTIEVPSACPNRNLFLRGIVSQSKGGNQRPAGAGNRGEYDSPRCHCRLQGFRGWIVDLDFLLPGHQTLQITGSAQGSAQLKSPPDQQQIDRFLFICV